MPKRVTQNEFATRGATANGHPDTMGSVGIMMYRRWKDHAAEQGTPFTGNVPQTPQMEVTELYPEETRAFLADQDPNTLRAARRHFGKE